MSILAQSPDLTKIIKKAVERIGENHSLARDNNGVTMSSHEIEEDRKEWRENKVIEESLKAVADEMAEKMVLENTIDSMIKDFIKEDVIVEQVVPIELPEGCEECLRVAIGEKYESKADKIIIAMTEFIVGGKMPSLIEIVALLEGINPMDAFTIGPELLGCAETCGISLSPEEIEYNQQAQTSGEYPSAKGWPAGNTLDESMTDTIKKLVKKKLKEANRETPGIDAYEKAFKESGKENKKYHKEFKSKFDKYGDFENNSHPEFPHQNNSKTDYKSPMYRGTTEDDEFVEDFAYPGLQDFDIHNQDMERLTDYLEGSSETGNAMTDSDDKALGNVVPDELGKKVLKSIKRRKEKIAAEKASMSNLRGYTPDVQKVKQIKESINSDIDKMKKLLSYNKITQ